MQQFWIVQKGKPVCVTGQINGEYADIPLPFGGFRRFKWPRWYASRVEAEGAIAKAQEKRLERAKRLLEASRVVA